MLSRSLSHTGRIAVLAGIAVMTLLLALLSLAPPSGAAGVSAAALGPLVEKYTTASSDTYRLPNGHMLTKIYARPINRRDASGQWQPIGQTSGAGSTLQPDLTAAPDAERPLGQENETACTLTSSTPTITACNELTFKAGYETTGAAARHALIQFVLPDLHEEETILSAQRTLRRENDDDLECRDGRLPCDQPVGARRYVEHHERQHSVDRTWRRLREPRKRNRRGGQLGGRRENGLGVLVSDAYGAGVVQRS